MVVFGYSSCFWLALVGVDSQDKNQRHPRELTTRLLFITESIIYSQCQKQLPSIAYHRSRVTFATEIVTEKTIHLAGVRNSTSFDGKVSADHINPT